MPRSYMHFRRVSEGSFGVAFGLIPSSQEKVCKLYKVDKVCRGGMCRTVRSVKNSTIKSAHGSSVAV